MFCRSAGLNHPLPATVDAIHESLIQHEHHHDQYYQLLLTLGTLGRRMRDDFVEEHDRVFATLQRHLDRAVSRNNEVEEVHTKDVAAADAAIAAMSEDEWHMWYVKLDARGG